MAVAGHWLALFFSYLLSGLIFANLLRLGQLEAALLRIYGPGLIVSTFFIVHVATINALCAGLTCLLGRWWFAPNLTVAASLAAVIPASVVLEGLYFGGGSGVVGDGAEIPVGITVNIAVLWGIMHVCFRLHYV